MTRLLGCLVVLFLAASGWAQGFTIQRFDSQMTLGASGELAVQERIHVRFFEAKRGIFRNIPVDYPTPSGRIRSISISNISVSDGQGISLQTKVSREGRNINIRIGDPAIFLMPGTEITYVINYSARRMLNAHKRNGEWDAWTELYWNIYGSEWPTPIEAGSFTLAFPAVPEDKQLRASVILGPVGSRNPILLEQPGTKGGLTLTRSELSMTLPRALNPGEEATIVVGLPPDLVEAQSWSDRLRETLEPYAGLMIPIPMLILGLLTWFLMGRDPWAARIKVAFDPPDELSPAHFGALVDEQVDPRDIAAAIVGLAVKGCLVIVPVEVPGIWKRKEATLKVTGTMKPGKFLSDFEKNLLQDIEGGGEYVDSYDLKSCVAPRIPWYKEQLYEDLVTRAYFPKSPATVRDSALGAGIAFCLLGGLIYVFSGIQGAFWSVVAGAILALIMIPSFIKLMPRATRTGAYAKAHARGFAEFLSHREHYMTWFAEKLAPQAMFEEYLPYAVALGIEASWVKSFEGILTEPIEWYGGAYTNMHDFGLDFGYIAYSFANNAGVAPRTVSSSWGDSDSDSGWGGGSGFGGGGSFGGGGFSGGGFGGGGGGSW